MVILFIHGYRNDVKRIDIGHYIQIVWAETYLIGCAVMQYKSNNVKTPYEALTYCNCGPGGNVSKVDEYGNEIGKPVYKNGKKPASLCPTGTKPNRPTLKLAFASNFNRISEGSTPTDDRSERSKQKKIILKQLNMISLTIVTPLL